MQYCFLPTYLRALFYAQQVLAIYYKSNSLYLVPIIAFSGVICLVAQSQELGERGICKMGDTGTVYLVISLPKIPYIHRVYKHLVLANSNYILRGRELAGLV
jgi:hypothetical protein